MGVNSDLNSDSRQCSNNTFIKSKHMSQAKCYKIILLYKNDGHLQETNTTLSVYAQT